MRRYKGRLAFDPDSGFHIDPAGKPVVTDDDGKTWRYATTSDLPHNDRYQQRLVTIDSTANRFAEVALEHGRAKAAELVEPHHFDVQPDDPHFEGLRSDPDAVAAKVTSHTEAYK